MLAPFDWNVDRVEQLKRLHAAGLSMSQIAAEMGQVSRNAVIGKLHRLGIDGRDRSISRNRRPKTVVELEVMRCVEVAALDLSLADLKADSCRYPFGDGPFTFCGHSRQAGSSYCASHQSLCKRVWVEKAA